MNCPNCGYPNAPTAMICDRCGQLLWVSEPTMPGRQPTYPVSFAPPPSPPRRRVRLHAPLFIGIVGITLIAVATAVGAAYLVSRQDKTPGLAAQTTLPTATTTALPTATVLPTPTATRPPTSTATPRPQLVTLFYDPLTSNRYGWPSDATSCYFKSDGYHIINGSACEAPLKPQTNVNISVTMKQIAGNPVIAYGIGFRVLSLDRTQYIFFINSEGSWVVEGPSGVMVSPQTTSALHKGMNAINTIAVDCTGSHFTFYINGVDVGSANDGSIASGAIALGMEPNQNAVGTQVVFTNFKVTQWQ